jgi:Tfp pilus assembly protein PilO
MMSQLRKRLLIGLAALLGLNAIGYLVFTLPRTLQQRNLDSRLRIAREAVERERQKQASLKARYDLVSANTRDATEFYQRRISARATALVPLLRDLEALARGRGLRVGKQSFSYEPVKGAPLDRFQVNLPAQGTYRELVEFVNDLERSSQFVTLDEIAVRAREGGEAEMKMVLSCYFRSAAGKQGT